MAIIIDFPSPNYLRKMAIVEHIATLMMHVKSLHDETHYNKIEECCKIICEVMISDGNHYTSELLETLVVDDKYLKYIENRFRELLDL